MSVEFRSMWVNIGRQFGCLDREHAAASRHRLSLKSMGFRPVSHEQDVLHGDLSLSHCTTTTGGSRTYRQHQQSFGMFRRAGISIAVVWTELMVKRRNRRTQFQFRRRPLRVQLYNYFHLSLFHRMHSCFIISPPHHSHSHAHLHFGTASTEQYQ